MILEYDQNGSHQGRLDGTSAKLSDVIVAHENTHPPKFGDPLSKRTFLKLL